MNKYEYVRQRPQSSVIFKRTQTKQREFTSLALPITSSISNLAQVQNSRSPQKTQIQNSMSQSIMKLKQEMTSVRNLQKKNFNPILKKIDFICRGVYFGQTPIQVQRNEEFDIELLKADNQLIIVHTFSKSSPLNVSITRQKGRIQIYVSKTIKDPTKELNDFVQRKDQFTIYQTDQSVFKTEFISMRIFAKTETELKLNISFGRVSKRIKKRRNQSEDLSRLQVKQENTTDIKMYPRSRSKCFISLNKKNLSNFEPKTQKLAFDNRKKERRKHRMMVRKRKMSLVREKKEGLLAEVHKAQTMKVVLAQARIQIQHQQQIRNRQKV